MWKPWQNHQRQGEWQPLSHRHGESLSILSKYASSPSICSQNGVGKKGHLCLTPRMDLTSPDVSPFLHTFAHIVMYSIWLSQSVYKWIGDNHRSDEVTRGWYYRVSLKNDTLIQNLTMSSRFYKYWKCLWQSHPWKNNIFLYFHLKILRFDVFHLK